MILLSFNQCCLEMVVGTQTQPKIVEILVLRDNMVVVPLTRHPNPSNLDWCKVIVALMA